MKENLKDKINLINNWRNPYKLSDNEYVTITYGLMRTGSEEASILNHLKHPFLFLLKQIKFPIIHFWIVNGVRII